MGRRKIGERPQLPKLYRHPTCGLSRFCRALSPECQPQGELGNESGVRYEKFNNRAFLGCGLAYVCGVSRSREAETREEITDRALALVVNRLCELTSGHGIARWLETDYVCNRKGERWLPEWREDAERPASKRPRVRVKDRQYLKDEESFESKAAPGKKDICMRVEVAPPQSGCSGRSAACPEHHYLHDFAMAPDE